MRRNFNREILIKYFNIFLLNCKKIKLENENCINEKLKKFYEKIENKNKENNIMDKLLNVDDEKIAKIFDLVATGKNFHFNFDENIKEGKNEELKNPLQEVSVSFK
jgi:hypothetical protein